jgi:hypothetical protein
MKKLGAFVVIGGALVAGLPSAASAAVWHIATLQCTIYYGTPPSQVVYGVQASTNVVKLPDSCIQGSPCANCIQDVLASNTHWGLFQPVSVTQSSTQYAGPYFVFEAYY